MYINYDHAHILCRVKPYQSYKVEVISGAVCWVHRNPLPSQIIYYLLFYESYGKPYLGISSYARASGASRVRPTTAYCTHCFTRAHYCLLEDRSLKSSQKGGYEFERTYMYIWF